MANNTRVQDSSTAQSEAAPYTWIDIQWISRHDPIHNLSSSIEFQPKRSSQTLQDELNNIKQQFMPAAASCADAINAYHERNGSNKRTNSSYEFRHARSTCNLYESLGATSSKQTGVKKRGRHVDQNASSGVNQFVNRSALKLANIDAVLGFSLVHPSNYRQPNPDADDSKSKTRGRSDEYFAFVDFCGAPGGFSEYILFRHLHPVDVHNGTISTGRSEHITTISHETSKLPCFGFGMSLIGSNEEGKGASWDVSHLKYYHEHQETGYKERKRKMRNQHAYKPLENANQHLQYNICNGSDGSGNIYNWENVLHLHREITSNLTNANLREETSSGLVHLVVADGGFDAQRDSLSQEEVAHRIIVSQTAAALQLLHPGGSFVIKMFGFQFERTKRILRYLYKHFDKMAFIKPIVSRPASAERYLVCLGYEGCDNNWDGLLWRDDIMMKCNAQSNEDPTDDTKSRFDDCLHSFDLEMLELNMDSCLSILDYLRKRKHAAEKGELVSEQQVNNIDLNLYELSWKLG
jgi:cap1 methyltransferase